MVIWGMLDSCDVATGREKRMPKTKLCENKEAVRCNYVAGMIVGGLRRGNIETDTASRKGRNV